MKNKEIEELLNDIKKQLTIEERLGKEIAKDFHTTTLNYKEIKLLLSYIEQLEKQAEQGDHYKHLYSEVKKQKDDVVEYVNSMVFEDSFTFVRERAEVKYKLLRMLGEIDNE